MPSLNAFPRRASHAPLQVTDGGWRGATAGSGRRQSPVLRSRSEISGGGGVARAWIVCVAMFFAPPLAAADNADVVHLKNGDRLTCEIQKLDRRVLSVGTDPFGKGSVHLSFTLGWKF